MGRAHEAALRGAVLAVAKYGCRKATMSDIAMLAGIAKATLYNHFRARDDIYRAAVAAEVESVAAAAFGCLAEGFDVALAETARLVCEHPAVRRVARDDLATLAALATPSDAEAWAVTRAHIAKALAEAGLSGDDAAVDLVTRYLASMMLAPASDAERRRGARLITRALGEGSA